MSKAIRVAIDVSGFLGLYALLESGILEAETPRHAKKSAIIEAEAQILSKENVLVNQQVEEIAQQILSMSLTKEKRRIISKRDWAECIEKLFSEDLSDELQSIALKERFIEEQQNETKIPMYHPSRMLGRFLQNLTLESFSPTEIKEVLTFKSIPPPQTNANGSSNPNTGESPPSSSSTSTLMQHPLTQVLSVIAEASSKHAALNNRFLQKMDLVEDQLALAYAERFTPQQAVDEEGKKSIAKIMTFASFFYFSSKIGASSLSSATTPIFRPFLQRVVQVSEGVWQTRYSFTQSLRRWFLGSVLYLSGFACMALFMNDLMISRKMKVTDWMYGEDVQRLVGKTPVSPPTSIAPSSSSSSRSLPSSSSPLVEDVGEDFAHSVEKELLMTMIAPAPARPLQWMGSEPQNPITPERLIIANLLRPITEIIVFYGFLLKQLLSYTHPVLAHTLTALLYALTREDEQDGRPDNIVVMLQLPFYESFAWSINRSLIHQLFYHLSGGSLSLSILLDLTHRARYTIEEVLATSAIYPPELSEMALHVLHILTITTNGPTPELLKTIQDILRSLASFFLTAPPSSPPLHVLFSSEVLKEVPNAKKIVQQLSRDLTHLYSSDNFSEKHLQKLSRSDLFSCIIRMEHYKRHCLPANTYKPLYLIDEEKIKKELKAYSPQTLKAISEQLAATNPSLLQQLLRSSAVDVTDRASYMREMQRAITEIAFRRMHSQRTLEIANNTKSTATTSSTPLTSSTSVDFAALDDYYMQSSSTLSELFYKQFIGIFYPDGSITEPQLEQLLTTYFNTIETKTLINELRKIEQAQRRDTQPHSTAQTAQSDLYSHMRYFEDLLQQGATKKEELLDIMQEMNAAVLTADEKLIRGVEPMLFQELQSSLLGRSLVHLERTSPFITPASKEFLSLPGVAQRMVVRREIFLSHLLKYRDAGRERYRLAVLHKHGLSWPYYQYLVNKYSAHYSSEFQQLQKEWEDFFNPTPLPQPTRSEIAGQMKGKDMNNAKMIEMMRSVKYASNSNYPERLKQVLRRDDPSRRIIYDDVTVAKISALKENISNKSIK